MSEDWASCPYRIYEDLSDVQSEYFSEIALILWQPNSCNSRHSLPFVNAQHRRSHLLVLILCLRRCFACAHSHECSRLNESHECMGKSLPYSRHLCHSFHSCLRPAHAFVEAIFRPDHAAESYKKQLRFSIDIRTMWIIGLEK